MLSAEQNDLITRTGPGTPAGKLMRCYWQPAALVDELAGNRPVKPLRLLGESLVLFRDDSGRYGLLERACPHRGTDLAFGRLETGGLRCAFHGWLFDVEGQCLETPAEPEGSRMCANIRQKAYPVVEKSGVLFAYMGPGEPPAFPHFDCFTAPDTHTFAFKGMIDCNWLQSLEVGIDPAHTSFLHRFFHDEEPAKGYGKLFRDKSIDSDMPMTKIMREFPRAQIEVEPTDYGMRVVTLRRISDANTHVRVTNLVFPHAFTIPMSSEMTITQWHVPIDDSRHYWYAIFTSFGAPVNKAEMRRQRLELYELLDYVPRKNKSNDYGFDPQEQEHETFTGMGADINVHDQWACESMGAIQDRTREHLGQSDKAISAYRRLLRGAIEQAGHGERPLMVLDTVGAGKLTGPAAIDGIGPTDGWQTYWRKTDDARRKASGWANGRRRAAQPSRRPDRSRVGGTPADCPPRRRADLSRRRPHSRDRPVRGRGPGGHPRADHRGCAGQAARAKRYCGESRRRRRQHCHGGRCPRQARRLHAPPHVERAGGEPVALQDRAVRSGQGFRADLAPGHLAQPDGRATRLRQHHGRVHRQGHGKAWAVELLDAGYRHQGPLRGRTAEVARRYRRRARALCERRTGGAVAADRNDATGLNRLAGRRAVGARRDAGRARGQRKGALANSARRADHGGARLSRLRRRDFHRPVRARGHTRRRGDSSDRRSREAVERPGRDREG